ncbi:MAG: DUF4396 domain-containing protein [Acidimicrobiia bacterium]
MAFLKGPGFIITWAISIVIGLAVLITDLMTRNRQIAPIMKLVWVLTVSYSGLMGLGIYFWSGRRQIARDTLWRRGARSVSHCFAGCGAGEIVGVVISVGLLSLGQVWLSVVTFVLAYVLGIAFNAGPLLSDGEDLSTALKDSVITESASILMMETVAIGVDQLIAGSVNTLTKPLFWSSLFISLSAGLLFAYPVNVWLVKAGIKKGMANPTLA